MGHLFAMPCAIYHFYDRKKVTRESFKNEMVLEGIFLKENDVPTVKN